MPEQEAYRLGTQSWWDNKSEWDNPYKSSTIQFTQWLRGRKREEELDCQMLWRKENEL